MKVSIGVSNRHVHLKEEDYKTLFGDEILNNVRNINQPGQFVSDKKVTIKGPKGLLERVSVLGPIRPYTQIEISKTDSFKLGLNPPIRESGDIKGSSPITLIGSKGSIDLKEGCIIAERHIHITPKQMEMYNLNGKEKVDVLVNGEKGGILFNVSLKVAKASYFEMHLDIDDANAHMIKQDDIAEIIE